ncbi:hypothetical protein CK203_102525 [Vitis vinifera]|uniref:Uncharacterized protein n=1 Tax=Vitis vinifera TaxID=29760 RepID=A0A438DV62_VITVI|nr:hypothetical protein CK203_102525 [Vitis vinifera]
MYFFGYRCCMKKNKIMHDTPSFPSDEEDEAPGGAFPISLEFTYSDFSSVFKNLSEDQRSAFEAPGPCFPVVVSGCPLLIVGHSDGCGLSYFICPIQISS